MDNEQVLNIAKAFREAIAGVPRKPFRTTLGCSEFPHGCCDDASQLLAAFFSDMGFAQSVRVSGIHGGNERELRTHVWLSCSKLIIDITGDQFQDYSQPPVFVSSESKFHQTFEVISKEPADFRLKHKNDRLWLSNFNSDYKLILSSINA